MHLIFEPQLTGHRREYLEHLTGFVEERKVGGVVFGVGEGFLRPKTQDLRPKSDLRHKNDDLRFISIRSGTAADLLRGLVVWRSWKYYRLALSVARNLFPAVSTPITRNQKPETRNRTPDTRYRDFHFTFLWLNDVQLFLGLLGFPCAVSGILFKPFIRMQLNSRKDKLTWKRKYWQTRLLVGQKKVNRIWILEDEEGVQELNRLFQTDKFAVLPEPVSLWEAEAGYDLRADNKIDPGSKVFLHIGTLSTRKGSDQIIRAVDELAKRTDQPVTILMAGKPQPGHEVIIRGAIESVGEHEHIRLIYRPQYLDEARFQAMMEQADGVLIPYLNPESSSGVLSRAILSGKPVLGVDAGLMGAMIRKYKAGVAIGRVTPADIADGIIRLCDVEGGGSEEMKKEFRLAHDSRHFAELLLGVD